ncbi:MAG: glycosyltransferase [Sphingomonadales bacterium]
MAKTTIVMTPRERFGITRQSYESLRQHTSGDYELVIVDGGSPPAVRDFLKAEAAKTGFDLIRTDYYLTPNEARNLGLARARGEFVVFSDNDVIYSDGWLQAMLDCAQEAGADIVAPVICIGRPVHTKLHITGGDVSFVEEDGVRRLVEDHRNAYRYFADVQEQLQREPCDFAEFHCVLVRRALFERLGPLDEGMKTTYEHIDFCLAAREAGASIWFEPKSIVTYFSPPPVDASDVAFYVTRWNDAWSIATMQHFMQKWRCVFDLEHRRRQVIERRRRIAFAKTQPWLVRVLGWRRSRAIMDWRERRIVAKSQARRAAAANVSAAAE